MIRQLKTLYANCFRVFTSHSVYEYSLGKNNKRVLINNVAALVPAVAMAGVSAVGMRRTKRGKSSQGFPLVKSINIIEFNATCIESVVETHTFNMSTWATEICYVSIHHFGKSDF